MSNSYRKNPVTGTTTSTSEKEDKRLANRRLRRVNKARVKLGLEALTLKEISDVWDFNKDGKSRFDWMKNERDPHWRKMYKKLIRK